MRSGFSQFVPFVLTAIWAGLSLGGSLIAAPAKFTVQSLELTVALEVGRAQFNWLAIAEWILLALIVLFVLVNLKRLPWRLYLIPIGIFLIQHFLIMPQLDQATSNIIAGIPNEPHGLHLYYVIAEILKFLSLVAISISGLRKQLQYQAIASIP